MVAYCVVMFAASALFAVFSFLLHKGKTDQSLNHPEQYAQMIGILVSKE